MLLISCLFQDFVSLQKLEKGNFLRNSLQIPDNIILKRIVVAISVIPTSSPKNDLLARKCRENSKNDNFFSVVLRDLIDTNDSF